MKAEFRAIVTVGIALAGLSVTGNQRLTAQIEQLDVRVRALETQVVRIEGRLVPPLTARTDPPAQWAARPAHSRPTLSTSSD